MFDLRQIGIGIAVIDQGIEKFRRLPDRLLAFLQAEVLLLLAEHIIHRLILVVQPVELGHAGIGLRIILAKLALRPAFLVAANQKLIPLLKIVQWPLGHRRSIFHGAFLPRRIGMVLTLRTIITGLARVQKKRVPATAPRGMARIADE